MLSINNRLKKMVEEKTRELEEQKNILAFYAHHDSLTTLPNRTLLIDRFNHAISLAKRQNSIVAVLFIDLDGFKGINDTYGHEAGDILLKSVAKKIQHVIRETDTVCRFGGDEFVVVLDSIEKNREYVVSVATRIIDSIAIPILDDGRTYGVTCSVGISIYPDNGETSELLLKNADRAMYEAKNNGKNRYFFYDRSMDALA